MTGIINNSDINDSAMPSESSDDMSPKQPPNSASPLLPENWGSKDEFYVDNKKRSRKYLMSN